MTLHCLSVPPIGANCYLVKSDASPAGVILDPGGAGEKILAECEKMSLTPAAILLTHGHFDHVGAVAELQRAYPNLPVYIHPADVGTRQPDLQFPGCPNQKPVGEGDSLTFNGLTISVLHTPGHSPGSVVYQIGDCLFTGDTLFAGSMGRTDFPGGSFPEMMSSLRRLASLEGDFKVYPGHMEFSTLEIERKNNPYLRQAVGK